MNQDKYRNMVTNDLIYRKNIRNMRISQKIYGFFGLCLFVFFIIMSTAHTFNYIQRKIIPNLKSFQFIHYVKGQSFFQNKEQQDLYYHANLIHEHEQVRKLREHEEMMKKTPLNEIRAKLHFRGHRCVNCPENTDTYFNSHLKDLAKNKLYQLKRTKNIQSYEDFEKMLQEDDNNNSTNQYENLKKMYKEIEYLNENHMFKEFDEFLFKIFDFTLEHDIPYVILEYAPNAVMSHKDLMNDYLLSNYVKLNMYDSKYKNLKEDIIDNIYKYHLCENYLGYDYIKIDPRMCVYPNIFVFENGVLIGIIKN